MTTLGIRVVGRPAPQGSHEVGANGHVLHSSNYLAAWRRAVQLAAFRELHAASIPPEALPVFGAGQPVYVHELTLVIGDEQCRAAGTDEPTGRPDVDKLLRATIDGLGDARLFADDSQIVQIDGLSKVRPWSGESPGAFIIISDRPRPVTTQGESMSTESTEYRISIERVGRDADGDRTYESLFELFGDAATVASAGLTTAGALLGAGTVAVERPEAPAAATEATPTKRGPGRPRKAATPPAQQAEAAPEAASAGETTESAPVPPQAVAQPVAEPAPAPAAAPARVNPFAQPSA